MADYEPYVADPAEQRPAPRLVRFRPLLATVAAALIAAALAHLVFRDRPLQDPAIGAVVPAPSPATATIG